MTKFIVNGKQGYKTYHDWKAFWGMKGTPSTPPGPTKEPFYMEDRGSGMRVSIKKMFDTAPTVPIEYSLDGTTWQSLGSTSTTALTIDIPTRGKVWLRAVTNAWATEYGEYNTINTTNNAFNIGGDILSLLYGANYKEATTITQSYAFSKLFYQAKVYDASELILPDAQPSMSCYYMMFYGCSHLHQAPVLPATTLASGCYSNMFGACNNLQQAPVLPATTLAPYCYTGMFYGCSSLTTAPTLPATTLAQNCYDNMFNSCYNLQQAPVLPATTLVSDCYYGMFFNCFSLTSAPELPATTLVSDCYYGMFKGCSSLNYIKCLAVSDENGYGDFREYCTGWVDGVSSSGTFIASDNYSQGWYWGKDGVPENWTTETESGNHFEPAQGGGGGTQIAQFNGFTMYEMGGEQGGYQFEADWRDMMVPSFNGNDHCFAMMKISADQGGSGDVRMTPYLGNGVTAYISYEVSDDGTCPFSYNSDDEYDYEYSLTNSDDGNQITPGIDSGNCRWVKFIKNQGTYEGNTPYISIDS